MADEKTLTNVKDSLSRIEGQIRGIRNMTAEGRLCVDIVTQIASVQGALNRVADMVVADHLHQWLKQAVGEKGAPSDVSVEELLKVFSQYYH